MATINNIKGTSYQSFCIGRRGITIYQGLETSTINAKSGDIFIDKTNSKILQFNGTEWKSYIYNTPTLDSISSLVLSNGYIKCDSSGFTVQPVENLKTDLSLGNAAYLSTGNNSGNIPILDSSGKLPSSVIPSLSMTTVSVVEKENNKPTSAKEGDVVIVTSTNSTYICTISSNTTPTWVALEVTSSVVSVNNKTGNVVLTSDDISSSYTPTNFTTSGSSLTSYITSIDNTFSKYVKKSDTGTVISYNVGNTAGQIPVLNSSGKLPASIITSSNTITKETSTTNTFPENPNINDILINSTTRSSFIWDGSNWQQLYTPNIVSVNGFTGSSSSSTDGMVLLSGNNINGTYIPKNYTLAVDSSSKTIKTLDSYFEGIDNAILSNSGGIKTVKSSQNITTSISGTELTIEGPDLSIYAKTSDIETEYLQLSGGILKGNLQGTSAGFSEKIYAATPESSSNDTSVATTAFVNLYATSKVAYSKFINLPPTPNIGMIYLVTDGLKPGEETGEGTGVLCVYDGKNWMNISSGTTIEI